MFQVDTVLSWIVGIGTAFIAGGLAYAGYSNVKKKGKAEKSIQFECSVYSQTCFNVYLY
jgi:hypothetical protein